MTDTFPCTDINILASLGLTIETAGALVKECAADANVCRVNLADIVLEDCACPLGSCCDTPNTPDVVTP